MEIKIPLMHKYKLSNVSIDQTKTSFILIFLHIYNYFHCFQAAGNVPSVPNLSKNYQIILWMENRLCMISPGSKSFEVLLKFLCINLISSDHDDVYIFIIILNKF